MTISAFIFWVLMAVLLLGGGLVGGLHISKTDGKGRFDVLTGSLLVWILLALLGWQTFGPLIKS